ncbi:hypothetical protein M8998_13415 [Sphingobacterium sp. lm-10]|uniref:RNA polymerase sigma factor n=1 Tax=Sphingobacterium sp. lm-10 TaxID=2944904 RepID=UPI0020204365|nr:hypothetical protein [Sphingobacterium sp. lm-10]MCL7988943.1 hypothetical protein [Sphingobacterium sp. lm-10]
MRIKQANYSSEQYVLFLNSGNELALDYFYACFYEDLYAGAKRTTGDAYTSRTFVQEAFFRLWLFRTRMKSMQNIESFLKEEIKRATREFYGNPSEQFHRSFVQLDGVQCDDRLWYLREYEGEQSRYTQCPEERLHIRKINALMPHLRQDQQTLIRLCLEYSFNYDRIADHLGGRSSHEVQSRVQQAIAQIRSVFENTEKLQVLDKHVMDADATYLNTEEALVLHLRCDQQLTFTEIATELNIELAVANNLFVRAYRKSKLSTFQSA